MLQRVFPRKALSAGSKESIAICNGMGQSTTDNVKEKPELVCANCQAQKREEVGTLIIDKSERLRKKIRREGVCAGDEKLESPGKNRPREPLILVDDMDRCILRRQIQEFYTMQKEVPTLEKLLKVAKEAINFQGGRETLRKVIRDMGFRFKTVEIQDLSRQTRWAADPELRSGLGWIPFGLWFLRRFSPAVGLKPDGLWRVLGINPFDLITWLGFSEVSPTEKANAGNQVFINRLRIGHTKLTHGYLLKKKPPPVCNTCSETLSVKHIVQDCPQYNQLRQQLEMADISQTDILSQENRSLDCFRKQRTNTLQGTRSLWNASNLSFPAGIGSRAPALTGQYCIHISYYSTARFVKIHPLVFGRNWVGSRCCGGGDEPRCDVHGSMECDISSRRVGTAPGAKSFLTPPVRRNVKLNCSAWFICCPRSGSSIGTRTSGILTLLQFCI
ncbi:hypothetical protein ANN_07312 [Periplaneta americana]|uniref:Uncharacterized protein n=1 Tax=Periplaneta americana TaxID=6978 RepID=A0ABQ8SYA0_PERAM|nr:hypothetical protein ANN_07312 [Periplaneta americana]